MDPRARKLIELIRAAAGLPPLPPEHIQKPVEVPEHTI